MGDDGLPHDVAAVSNQLPTFYPADSLRAMQEKLDVYTRDGTYALVGGTVPIDMDDVWTAGDVWAHLITLVLTHTDAVTGGYHLTDTQAVQDAFEAFTPSDERLALAAAEARLLLQATYANAGDNDYARGLAGAEHLLLDVEILHARASENLA